MCMCVPMCVCVQWGGALGKLICVVVVSWLDNIFQKNCRMQTINKNKIQIVKLFFFSG